MLVLLVKVGDQEILKIQGEAEIQLGQRLVIKP